MQRRRFLQQSTLLTAASFMPFRSSYATAANRQFTMSLDPGAIGVEVDQPRLIELAAQYGFEAVTPYPAFLVRQDPAAVDDLLVSMQEKNLVWGVGGLTFDFRQDEATFRAGMDELPQQAQALQRAGVTRIGTWVMPTHPELNYLDNFQLHTERIREIARVFQDHDIRFGLEYVGPKTLRDRDRYAFVSTMRETKALIKEINLPNVGLILDSFHWYTAEESVDDILTLKNQDVVACDLNDARAGRGPREQIDGERELPLASQVVATQDFLEALIKIDYDGPVRAEPFNQVLNDMDDEEAVATTAQAMKQAFALVG